jgi:hypothetical protein
MPSKFKHHWQFINYGGALDGKSVKTVAPQIQGPSTTITRISVALS